MGMGYFVNSLINDKNISMRSNFVLSVFTGLNTAMLIVFLVFYLIKENDIVYVDSAKLINDYRGMQDARKSFQQKATGWKANVDTLTSEVQKQIMDYEKNSIKMAAKERQLSEELIKTKQAQLRQYQQAMNAQAQQEDAKMTGEVVSQVNAYLKKYGEEKGYTIIMAATEYGNLAYADDKLDITDEVLKGLNDQYAGR